MGLSDGDSGDSVDAERIAEALALGHSGGHKAGLLGAGGPTFLTTKVDFVVNWARRNSLWPMQKPAQLALTYQFSSDKFLL